MALHLFHLLELLVLIHTPQCSRLELLALVFLRCLEQHNTIHKPLLLIWGQTPSGHLIQPQAATRQTHPLRCSLASHHRILLF